MGVVVLLAIGVPVALASHQFTDVPDSNPFHTEISNLAGSGITSGKTCAPPGTPPTFCPDEPVLRQSMAAFLNRGLGRVANGFGSSAVVADDWTDLGTLTINVGGAPGGTQFVKLDASVGLYIFSTTGCPCAAEFALFDAGTDAMVSLNHFELLDNVTPTTFYGLTGDTTASLTTVVAVPTGTTKTYEVRANRLEDAPAAGTLYGYSQLTAITGVFGSTGGNTLGVSGTLPKGKPTP